MTPVVERVDREAAWAVARELLLLNAPDAVRDEWIATGNAPADLSLEDVVTLARAFARNRRRERPTGSGQARGARLRGEAARAAARGCDAHSRARREQAMTDLELVRAVLAAAEEIEKRLGCGDNGCLFARPKGMGTNAGCRCIESHPRRPFLPRSIAALLKAVRELHAAEARLGGGGE